MLPRRSAARDRRPDRRRPGLRVPGRADLARALARPDASSRCRSASASAGSASRRCPRRSPSRRPGAFRPCATGRGGGVHWRRTSDLPIHWYMKAEQLALVQGWDDTRATLRRWNAAPWGVLRVLGARLARGHGAAAGRDLGRRDAPRTPDPGAYGYPGLTRPADLHDFCFVLARNGTVLDAARPGVRRGLHRRRVDAARSPRATPASGAGSTSWPGRRRSRSSPPRRSSRSARRPTRSATSPPTSPRSSASRRSLLLLTLTPHALPELFALFLPLAAWTIASRRGAWNELLAATFATTAVAVPLLIVAAAIETWVTPGLLLAGSIRRYTF